MRKSKLQIIIYQAEEGKTRLEVRLDDETVWLTQSLKAELFQTSNDNIGLHLKNIYAEAELDAKATTEDFSVVQQEGARQVITPDTGGKSSINFT